MLRPYISTSATAAVTRSARTIPSAPSVFSYHSLVRCASPALPPAPRAIAGTPRAIATFASVDALASSASLPSIRLAAIAACTSGWVRGVTPDGRSPRSWISTPSGGVAGGGGGVSSSPRRGPGARPGAPGCARALGGLPGRGRWRPRPPRARATTVERARAHPPQVPRPLLANRGREQNRPRGPESRCDDGLGHGDERRDAAGVVRDPGPLEPPAPALDRDVHVGPEHRIEMRGQDHGRNRFPSP